MRGRPWLTTLLFLLALLHQFAWTWRYNLVEGDEQTQMAAAQSLWHGHGITLAEADPTDLSKPAYVPMVAWPPGFTLLAVPVLALCDDELSASLVLKWLAAVGFFVAWRLILRTVVTDANSGSELFWGWWGLVYTPLLRPYTSGQLALALFSLGLLAFLRSVTAPPLRRTALAVTAGLAEGLAGAVHYSYWPLAFVPPAAVVLLVGQTRRRLLGVATVAAASSALVLAIVLAYLLPRMTASWAVRALRPATFQGLQWSNLAGFLPFPAYALGIERIMPRALARVGIEVSWEWLVLWLISLPLLVLLGRATRDTYKDSRCDDEHLASSLLWLMGVVGLAVTVAELSILSLRVPIYYSEFFPMGWTFVVEPRYYAVVYPFIFLAATQAVAGPKELRLNGVARLVAGLLFGLVILGTGYWRFGIWRLQHTWRRPPSDLAQIVRAERNHNLPIVYVGQLEGRCNQARLAGAAALCTDHLPADLETTRPVRVILALPRSGTQQGALLKKSQAGTEFREFQVGASTLVIATLRSADAR